MQKPWWAVLGALVVIISACSSSDRKFSDTATGGAAGSGGASGAGGSGGAGQDGGVVDCIGKQPGTNCSPEGSTGSICLNGECVVSRCGDGYVDVSIGEDCESGDGCTVCKFGCKMDVDCSDGDTCNGTEKCDTTKHACAAGTSAADGTMCTLPGGAPGKCSTATCIPVQCGNGMIDAGEECDPGTAMAEGCTKDCKWVCKADADCDDGDVCTGVEKCDVSKHVCLAGTMLNCDDMKVCTVDTCDPATGCQNAQVDADKDGFTVCDGDCNDMDPNINPGHAECADGKDNNCNKMIDEGVSPLQCYPDGDKDGFALAGATPMAVNACSCPVGYTTRSPANAATTDCADHVAAAFPGQTAYFPTWYCKTACTSRVCTVCLIANTSYDYNCDGVNTQHWTALAKTCSFVKIGAFTVCSGSGWVGTVPACGVSGMYQDCKPLLTSCVPSKAARTQECR
jgi:hypothetical protein